MHLIYRITIILILSAIVLSCKKKDTESPTLQVSSPVENSMYQAFDNVVIKGTASDNNIVESIKVTLKTATGTSVLETKSVSGGTKDYDFETTYSLDDIYLETGSYYFKVTAYDSEGNHSSEFVNVYIDEYPRRLKGIYYVHEDVLNTNIYQVDSLWSDQLKHQYSGDFMNGCSNDHGQAIAVSGDTTGDMHIYAYDGSGAYTITTSSALPNPKFTALRQEGKATYISYYNGKISGYTSSGSGLNAFYVESGYYPVDFNLNEEYIVVVERGLSGGQTNISSYYTTSGSKHSTYNQITGDVQDLVVTPTNSANLFIKDAGILYLYSLDITSNQYTLLKNLGGTDIYDIAPNGTGAYYLLLSTGVSLYNPDGNSIQLIAAGNFDALAYDDLSNQLFTSSANTITVRNGTSGSAISNYTMKGNVNKIILRYNK